MPELDIQHFKNELLAKEQELVSTLARFGEQSETKSSQVDVGDAIDKATTEENTWISVEESEVLSRTLRDVREALQRIDNGTYGRCVACGRPIERERLEAVPWTPFCREDQEKADARRPTPTTSTL